MRFGPGIGIPSRRRGGPSGPVLSTPTLTLTVTEANEGDDLLAEATVDDGDGATTSDVQLYLNGVLVDSMTDDGGGAWSLAVNDVLPGTHSYVARRITDLGNRSSAPWVVEVAAAPPDVTAPTLVSAVIDAAGTTLTLTYDEALDTGSSPATGAFSLAGTARTVSGVNVTGMTVVLTLSGAVAQGATVTVSYTAGASPIQDTAGNDAANLTNQAVTNNSTSDQTAPTRSSIAVNAAGSKIIVTYNETLDGASVPALGAFTLAGPALSVLTGTPAIVGATVELSVTPAICVDESGITLSYTAGGSPVQDAAGNDAANFTTQTVTNNSTHVFEGSDISGLIGWFDTQHGASITLNGGGTAATQILNRVGGAVYDTPANDVPYEATGLNGNPCLHPAGVTGDRMQAADASITPSVQNTPTALSVVTFLSYDVEDAGLRYHLSFCNSASNNGSHSFGQSNTGSGRVLYRSVNDSGTSAATETSATTVPSTAGHVGIWTLAAGSVSYFQAGAAGDPVGATNNPGPVTVDRVSLNCKGDSTPDSAASARWGEILIYSKVLSAAERARLENRLPIKWA